MNFTVDEEGLAQLLSTPTAEAALTSIAGDIAHDWERLDPRSRPGGHEPPTINVGSPQRDNGVAMVPVATDDGIWHIIEFGSVNNPPYRPATKAVLNAGLRFEESR